MEWIKCSDRLPDENKDILFLYYNQIHIGNFLRINEDGSYTFRSMLDQYNCLPDIEYWMPLPPIPSEIKYE